MPDAHGFPPRTSGGRRAGAALGAVAARSPTRVGPGPIAVRPSTLGPSAMGPQSTPKLKFERNWNNINKF